MERDRDERAGVFLRNMEQSWVIGKCCIVGSARRGKKQKAKQKQKTSLGWIVQGHVRDPEEFGLCQRAVK